MKSEAVEKTTAILTLVSMILYLVGIIPFAILIDSSDLFKRFIAEWFFVQFMLLSLPFLFHWFARLVWIDKLITAKIWLIIYAIAVVLFILIAFRSGYIARARDLPMAFRRNYVSIEGEAHSIRDTDSSQVVSIANKQFNLREADFNKVTGNNTYQINYLPNSRYVIDVIDENGRSLSRR